MVARARANVEALRAVRTGTFDDLERRRIAARWSGWGALAPLFGDPDNLTGGLAEVHTELRGLLSERQWNASAASTINAHYTPPAIAGAVWSIVTEAGYKGGLVLEPGSGSGVFMATAPAAAWESGIVGVEKDPITAEIGRFVHPDAQVINQPLEAWVGEGFSAAVGNVPFADVSIYDRHVSPRRQLSLHNFAIAKGLYSCAPGGIVAVITSSYTLDAANPRQRIEIGRYGRFVGAVRLPETTFAAHSGTRVTTDLVVLQRRTRILSADEVRADGAAWLEVGEWPNPAIRINQWFVDRPGLVLGTVTTGNGLYREDQLSVVDDDNPTPLAERLRTCGRQIVTEGRLEPVPQASRPGPRLKTVEQRTEWTPPSWAKERSILAVASGFRQIRDGNAVPFEPTAETQRPELSRALAVRDAVISLIAAEADDEPPEILDRLRADLNRVYDRYVAAHGYVNRYAWTRSATPSRRYPPMGGFRAQDPDYPAVLALENFDHDAMTATKADIFHRRVINPPTVDVEVDSIEAAAAASLRAKGTIDLGYMADVWPDTTPKALVGVCYLDPEANRWELAARYLSGNVRAKLAVAEAAAEHDPQYQANVDALWEVIPADLEPSEIGLRLGVPWVTAEEVAEFVADTLETGRDAVSVSYNPHSGWSVVGQAKWTMAATATWGTERRDAYNLVEAALNGRRVEIYDEHPDGRRVLNTEATLQAAEKIEALNEAFASWAWDQDSARSTMLQRRYNDRFRAYRPASYDGSWIQPQGLRAGFQLREHQADAVAQILMERSVLLGHVVGAGKTATMATAAVELRRLGLAHKPAIVVPNHLVEQVAGEFRQLYPGANVLLPTSAETTKQGRKELAARASTGDWDAIVLAESTFMRIGLPAEVEQRFREESIEEYREAIDAGRERGDAASERSVKQLAKMIEREEQRINQLRDKATDDGVTWDQLGVDALFVDEAHRFKNLDVVSANRDFAETGSQQAKDLDFKLRWMRQQYPDTAVVVLSTGTPVANKVAELHVMQRYVQPARLEELGVRHFDAWAAQFGKVVTQMETKPTGQGFQLKSRFAEYQNVPELMAALGENATIRLAEDLNLPRPAINGGQPQIELVPATPELEAYVDELVERSENLSGGWSPDKGEDNMLKITGDGRKAALHLGLVGLRQSDPSKVTRAAERITQIWAENRDRKFTDTATGEIADRPGALQVVFCDLGTPGGASELCVYDELRARLIDAGMPADDVAYIHDAKKPAAKAELFARCRTGEISVLMGSTEKMGTGTNVQTRLIALHHLDPAWRPADIEQREGRILRQGNQCDEVHVFRYATERSFDVYMWQGLERKARFIGQLLAGRDSETREMSEIATPALSFAEVKALATGDPRIIERAELGSEADRLSRLDHAHRHDQQRLVDCIAHADNTKPGLEERRDRLADLIEIRTGDDVRLMSGRDCTARELDQAIGRALGGLTGGQETPVAVAGGLPVIASRPHLHAWELRIGNQPNDPTLGFERHELNVASSGVQFGQRLRNELKRLDERHDTTLGILANNADNKAQAEQKLGTTFRHAARLTEVKQRIAELDAEFEREATAGPAPNSAAEDHAVADARELLVELARREHPTGASLDRSPTREY